ncbi:MAG: peptide ABC transporter substrate-binding protein [Thermomicrobiales bacterium]|nr:peptide ABC transporter substrate-binding protein [Thermomicrobiales bacterium]
MLRTSRLWVRLASLVVGLALIVPTLATGVAAQDDGSVVRVQQITYPDVVDPQKSSFTSEIAILALVYEGLTRLDDTQATVPAAAESWEYNDDATSITFTLRPDLKFSDGSPLTAENFRYAIERTCDPVTAGEYQSILFDIVGCAEFAGLALDESGEARDFTPEEHEAARAALGATAVDDRTLQIDMVRPVPFMHTLAYTWVFYPVKAEVVAADPDNWWKSAENHIGNGPFAVTSIAEDQEWSFAANDNYWQGRPKLDGIDYVYVDDSSVALEAYRAGDLDIVSIQPPQMPEVEADPDLAAALVSYPSASTFNLAMNLAQEPFNDVKVREAFAYAMDRETLCADLRAGDCTPALSWVPPGVAGAIETDAFAFDPEAAVQALADSSYGGPENLPEIKIYYNSDTSGRGEQVEWVAGQIRDILGVELTIEPTDGTTLTALRKDSTTHPQLLFVGGWIQDYPDPQNWLSVYWTCSSTFAERTGYCNEEFDKLIEQGDTTVDPDARLTFYEQAGELLVADQPGPFLYNLTQKFVVNPAITGYTPTASEVEWPGYLGSIMTIEKAS